MSAKSQTKLNFSQQFEVWVGEDIFAKLFYSALKSNIVFKISKWIWWKFPKIIYIVQFWVVKVLILLILLFSHLLNLGGLIWIPRPLKAVNLQIQKFSFIQYFNSIFWYNNCKIYLPFHRIHQLSWKLSRWAKKVLNY